MKKQTLATLDITLSGAAAQKKGRMEVYDFDSFKLHVYYTNDALGDASYIVEGRDGLVTMEQPLFKDNVAEFDAYLARLGKEVVARVTDYHVGGTGHDEVVMPAGMKQFTDGDVYGGMMQGFAQAFGDAIVGLPDGNVTEVDFDSTQVYAGVTFDFHHGAATDFPAAMIVIGGKVCYTHWAPAKAHANALQLSSPGAVDAELLMAEQSLATSAELFTGGHGGAVGRAEAEAHLSYLKRLKSLLAECNDAQSLAAALREAYPGLHGEDGLGALCKALCPGE